MEKWSWQDSQQRVEILEEKIDFMMRATPVVMRSTVTDANGRHRQIQTNLLEVFRQSKAAGLTVDGVQEVETGSEPSQRFGDEVV